MLDLLPRRGFGDNLRPARVTEKIREELLSADRRMRNRILLAPLLMVAAADLLSWGSSQSLGAWIPWRSVLAGELAGLAAFALLVSRVFAGRIQVVRDGTVTTAMVMDSDTTDLWLLDSGTASSPFSRSPEKLHVVTVRLRFVPGFAGEELSWESLKDEMPHCDVTRRLRGGWGTSVSELKAGSLISVLYLPDSPRRCRIILRRGSQS
jgi:hypothetical protein